LVSQNKKYIDSFFVYAESPNGEIIKLKKWEDAPKGWRRFRLGNFSSPRYSPSLVYEYKGYKPPEKGWKVTKEKMEELDKHGRLYFPQNKNGRIQTKSYLDEGMCLGETRNNQGDSFVYDGKISKSKRKLLEGGINVFTSSFLRAKHIRMKL
jgi:hypothetical protein